MPLTDTAIRNAKPGRTPKGEATSRPYRLADGSGMYLEVAPAGGKWWRLKYRFGGKEKRLSLGTYPEISLAAARQRRDEARRLLAAGTDPSEHRRAEKVARSIAQANSFEAVAREWHAQKAKVWAKVTTTKAQTHLETYLFPKLGPRPISEIQAPELLAALRDVEKRGAVYTATRLREMAGQVFRYAIATGRADYNPAADLKGALQAPVVTHRAALTSRKGFAVFLRDLKAYRAAEPVTLLATRFAMLTFVRSQELRFARWEEVDFKGAEWKVPARRMKAGKALQAHTVPLSLQAIAVLRELEALTGRGPYLFPSSYGADRVMSENTIGQMLKKMGYQGRQSLHGFRASARSLLSERGWSTAALERQLDHAERNKVVAAYARSEHLDERRALMKDWGALIEALERGAEILPVRTAA